MRSPANVVNVFIRNLEFRLVARQQLFIHMAKLSRMRVPFSGLLSYCIYFLLVKGYLLNSDFNILLRSVHTCPEKLLTVVKCDYILLNFKKIGLIEL